MDISKRIETIVEYSQMTIPQLAKSVGFKTPQTIRSLIKGETKTLSDAVVLKLTSYYPQLNRTWLLTGEGEMLNKETAEASAPASATTTNTQSENTTAIAALKDTVDKLLDTLNRQMAILEDTARTNDRYSRVIERMTMQQQAKNEQPDSYLQRRQDVG